VNLLKQVMKYNVFLVTLVFICNCSNNQSFLSSFPTNVERTWIGPEYWTNPLQDWQLNNGRIECIISGGNRNVFLLTHELSEKQGSVKMNVKIGQLTEDTEELNPGWVGFYVGVRGEFQDYRDNAVRGEGFPVGMTTNGQLFIGRLNESIDKITVPFQDIRLEFSANLEKENYNLTLSAYTEDEKILSSISRDDIGADWLQGGVALVCSNGKFVDMPNERGPIDNPTWDAKPGTRRGGNVRFWFTDWKLSGTKVKAYPKREYGPFLFSQYTLSNKIIKLTAQMAPIGQVDDKIVQLQIQNDGNWQTISEEKIDGMSRTATFRIENWDNSKDIPYRLFCDYFTSNVKTTAKFTGTIRKEPWEKEEIVVAGFTGNNDLGFPNNDIIKQLNYHNPDLLFFSGDQIYEGVGGFGVQRAPIDKACLDYLRKWYIFGWTYRDLMRDRPSISIPDDHDVYHGNIWGAGGIATPPGLSGQNAQDAGGYKMPPDWVNMVQRTQSSSLPDPYDSTPVEQDISVYYTNMNYGGISFAILEDRKFKLPPKKFLPKAKVKNGWAQNRSFNVKKEGDAIGAVLLGERQLSFLEDWAADWSEQTWMKVALSQTIFANVATLPREDATSDVIVPRLRILEKDEYPPDDIPVSDMDSNGWPQTGRNKALIELRKAFAFHLAGDQHLGSTIQYGIDDWYDAGYAFCVPAVSNVWPRRWYPNVPGRNRKTGSPNYTGDFEDGFGNKITVHAISNPVFTGLKPSRLYDRATGYGIVRFNRKTRDITIECWPRLSDPTKTDDGQYPDWPVVINQLENCGKNADYLLPKLKMDGMMDPIVQVIDELKNDIIFTIRIKGTEFQPKVFKPGLYTIKVGEFDRNQIKEFKNVPSLTKDETQELEVKF